MDEKKLRANKCQTYACSSQAPKLGLVSATFLVVANMVGVGVFTTSGYALKALGHPALVMLCWVIGGMLALAGALCYGALSQHCSESGGEYTFLSRLVHPALGYMAGWVSLLAGFTAPTAAAALALQAYLGWLWTIDVDTRWLGTIAIILAGTIHGTNLRYAIKLQNLVILFKLILIIIFIFIGSNYNLATLHFIKYEKFDVVTKLDISNFAVSLIWISFAYSGWNAAVYIGSEVKQAHKNLNRSLLLGTTFVIVLYLFLNMIFLYTTSAPQVSGKTEIAIIVAKHIGGETLYRLVSAFVSLALFTSILSMVMTGPRVYSRMADDGVFPKLLRSRRSVPHAAIVLQVTLAIIVLWLSDLAELLGYIGFTLGLSAALTIGAFMRFKYLNKDQGISLPGYPWLPFIFIGFTLLTSGFLVMQAPVQAALGMLTLCLGLPFYYLTKQKIVQV